MQPEDALPGDTPPDDSPSTDTWQSENGSDIIIRHPEAESHGESVSGRSDQDNPSPPLRKRKRFKRLLEMIFPHKARR